MGRSTDLQQTVESMEIEHRMVDAAAAGDDMAIRVTGKVRDGDQVYRETQDTGASEEQGE